MMNSVLGHLTACRPRRRPLPRRLYFTSAMPSLATARRSLVLIGHLETNVEDGDYRERAGRCCSAIDPAILTRAFANDALQLPQPPLAPKPRPRPRRLVPDAALIRRRAAGEPLRQLAHDYQVNHTTLSRYFARTEINRQLQHTRRQLRAQQRARTAGRRSAQPPPDSNHAAQPHN
jgi:hypothetical protein